MDKIMNITSRCLLLAATLLVPTLALGMTEPQLRRSGFVGVQVGPVTSESRSSNDVAANRGVVVLGLVKGGSAIAAGLKEGDILLAANGTQVEGPLEFAKFVARLRAGDEVAIQYVRDGIPGTTRVMIRPRPLESTSDVETEYRAVAVDGSVRRTIVTRPKSTGRHPAVLYMTGIGCASQESFGVQTTEAKLLYGLTRAGLVTMRVEKSGVGDSQGAACDSEQADLRSEVRAYTAGLRALRAYDFVDRGNIFLLGLSIGGVEAPLVAQEESVKGIIVINTVARSFLDYLEDIRRTQGTLRSTPYDVLESRLRLNSSCNYRLFVEHEPRESLIEKSPECRDFIEYPAPYAFMQQWADLNPAAEWKKVTAPALILHGEFDFIASPVDARYLRDMVNSFHPGLATFSSVPRMDHYLGHVGSWADSLAKTSGTSGEIEPEVIATVTDWIKSHTN